MSMLTQLTQHDLATMASSFNIKAFLSSGTCLLKYLLIGGLTYLSGVVIYRLYFHPLSKYPGPFFAKITDWYNVYHCLSGDRHLEFYSLHERYGQFLSVESRTVGADVKPAQGDYVRFGPNRMSINTATGLKKIYGTKANVQKSRNFEVFLNFFGHWSTQTMIDTVEHRHTKKRRVLAQALSDSSLSEMEDAILESVGKFCSLLSPSSAKEDGWSNAVNMAEATSFLSFDIMGIVCFGRSFEMLDTPGNRYILNVVSDGAQCLNTLGHMQGILKTGIPNLLFRPLLFGLQRYKEYSRQQCESNINAPQVIHRNVFQSLLAAVDEDTGERLFTRGELQSESSLLIIAGSDTTSTCLASTIFYLLDNPGALSLAQTEIRSKFDRPEDIRLGPRLYSCNYLRACVKESLRLSPPVGGLMPREVLRGGVEIDGHFFPPGTEVGTPHYAIHHKELHFPDAFAFKPERWTGSEKDEKGKADDAFCAFTLGARSCVGQAMAYHEIMLVLARVLDQFDLRFSRASSRGRGGPHLSAKRRRVDEYQLYDTFVSRSDGPMVEFRRIDPLRSPANHLQAMRRKHKPVTCPVP